MELPPTLHPRAHPTDEELCWCLSGQPYSECHKNREKQKKANPKQALDILAKQFRKKIGCLHPNSPEGCSGKIINSHTIQKSGPLKTIAKNGEFYSMKGAGDRLVENMGKLIPQKKGISTVSVFPGFCAHHDNEFFSPIENGKFEITRENCFLLHYRNVCSELHAKKSMQFGEHILSIIDSGRGKFDQFLAQQQAADMNFGASMAEKELEASRDQLNAYWIAKDFSSISFYFIEFENQLPFVGSFSATPKFSFAGDKIQDWSEEILKGVSFSSVNFDGKSGFVISSTDQDLMDLLSSELEDFLIGTPSNILRWSVSNAENLAFNIDWWDHLSDKRRKHILDLAMIGMPVDDIADEIELYLSAVEVLPKARLSRSLKL